MNESNAPVDAVKTPGDGLSRAALGTGRPAGTGTQPGRRFEFVLELLLFGAMLVLPVVLFGDDRYWLPIFTRLMALAIFAMSVDLVWGYTGLLSLGQGLYFGLGSYAIAYSLKMKQAAVDADLPVGTPAMPDFMMWCRLPEVPIWVAPLANIWIAIAVAVLLPLAVSALFGLVVFLARIKGVFFALITQALLLAIFTLVDNQQPYTGGRVGMPGLARLELFGHTFKGLQETYWLLAGSLLVSFLVCLALVRSKFGKVLTAIRDSELRTMALGYNTGLYKTFAFALAGGMAGFAGALYTAAQRTVGPTEVLDIGFSIEIVILVAVGGRGTLIGPVFGTLLVMAGKVYINDAYEGHWPFILGGLFVVVVLFLPQGIVGLLRQAPARLKKLFSRQQAALAAIKR